MYRSGVDFGHGVGSSRGSASAFIADTATGDRYKRVSEPGLVLGTNCTKKSGHALHDAGISAAFRCCREHHEQWPMIRTSSLGHLRV